MSDIYTLAEPYGTGRTFIPHNCHTHHLTALTITPIPYLQTVTITGTDVFGSLFILSILVFIIFENKIKQHLGTSTKTTE